VEGGKETRKIERVGKTQTRGMEEQKDSER
jgi:hypothetical protein